MSSKTDRYLIAIALLILLLTVGGLFGFDSLWTKEDRAASGEQAVAEIVARQGDVRVKYSDEIRWQKGRDEQKLLLNDSVFAGANSQVELAVGESKLKVEANTLIVLRKDSMFKTLNLNYGSLSGLLAKNDKLVIETADGEKFEMNAGEATKIKIQRKGKKTSIRVIEGNAKIVKDGKVQNLSSRDHIEFSEKKRLDPLVFQSPARYVSYSAESNVPVRFAWGYASRRAAGPQDEFTLEMSADPEFHQLVMREDLHGVSEFSAALASPQELYYRVRDGDGNFSESRRLRLLKPEVPRILLPEDGAVLDSEAGQSFPVELETTPLQPESKILLTIARDPGFVDVFATKTLLEPRARFDLPLGNYFLRARAEYADFSGEWSASTRILVRRKLAPQVLAQIALPKLIVIPHRPYPKRLYSAKTRDVQAFLKDAPEFSAFFKPLTFGGYEVVASRGEELRIENGRFPAEWIEPSSFKFKYELRTEGAPGPAPAEHEVRIEMQAPQNLADAGDGRLAWSPVLFAKGYQVDTGGQKPAVVRSAGYHYRAKPGRYAFRVRALNANSRPISPWSATRNFEIAAPAPEPQIELTENSPPLEREPAQENAASTSALKIEPERTLSWQRHGFWAWLGGGFNFFDMRQTVNNQAQVSYQNAKGPSLFAELGYMAKNRFGGIFGFKRTPGEVRIDNYPVREPNFVWDTYSLEAIYGLPFITRIFNTTLNWGLRAGVQKHSFPFLYIDTGRTVINSQSEMTAASVGFFMETTGRWKQHWHMRFQQPLEASTSGGNSFDISPKAAFDGSIGTSYLLTERLKTGLFWYGQLHNYDFTYRSPTQTNVGNQSLFYSNLELRLGLDF